MYFILHLCSIKQNSLFKMKYDKIKKKLIIYNLFFITSFIYNGFLFSYIGFYITRLWLNDFSVANLVLQRRVSRAEKRGICDSKMTQVVPANHSNKNRVITILIQSDKTRFQNVFVTLPRRRRFNHKRYDFYAANFRRHSQTS